MSTTNQIPESHPAETKLVRVVRREFYDAFGATTYYLRMPVGMTAEEIEQHDCWHDGIDKDSHPYRDGLVCVGRVNGSDADVIATLETTGGREIDEVTEITEADLLLETEEEEEEELLLRDVDDGIDVANEAAATINARLARLGLQLTEQAVEALWRAVGGLEVVDAEDQADG